MGGDMTYEKRSILLKLTVLEERDLIFSFFFSRVHS